MTPFRSTAPPADMAPRLRLPGFTILEVMIALAVITTVAALALPRLDYAGFRIDRAMQAVGETLLTAQRQAIAKQRSVLVTFDVPGRALTVLHDENGNRMPDHGERRRIVPLDEAISFGLGGTPALTIGDNAINLQTYVDGRPAIEFRRDGSASTGGGIYLTSQRSAAGDLGWITDTRVLSITQATGRVEWLHFDGTEWLRGF